MNPACILFDKDFKPGHVTFDMHVDGLKGSIGLVGQRADGFRHTRRRIDLDAAPARRLVGVFRDQRHVHVGRLSGLVEALARNHRIVPVEHLSVLGSRTGRRQHRI